MVDTLFQVGDHVRVRVATVFVQAGTRGTVCGSYPVMPGAYDIVFEGQQKSWMMWDDELEPATTDATPDRANTFG